MKGSEGTVCGVLYVTVYANRMSYAFPLEAAETGLGQGIEEGVGHRPLLQQGARSIAQL